MQRRAPGTTRGLGAQRARSSASSGAAAYALAAKPARTPVRRSRSRRLPAGPPLPSWLQTLAFWTDLDRFLRAAARRYGSTFTVRVFPWGEVVVVSDAHAIRTVFTGDPEAWRGGESYRLLGPLIGPRSLVLLDGEEHLRVRRQLLAPFHGEAVRRHEQAIEAVAQAEVERWPLGRAFELTERMRAITLEVMLHCVIGAEQRRRLDELRSTLAEAVKLRPLMLLMWACPPLARVPPWRSFDRRLERAKALLREEIARRRADPAVGERADVLSCLIGACELDEEMLLDQLTTLLLAGHDTTATSLVWAVERLVRHPQALARAREDERYLDAVVKETLRTRPALPAVTRRTTREVQLDGWTLPAGVTVMPGIRLAHLCERHFADPDAFRPERFLEGEGGGYAWVPFGGGTHRCIGAAFAAFQMRVVLRTILARAELAPDRPREERIRNEHVTLVPARDGRVVKVRSLQPGATAARMG